MSPQAPLLFGGFDRLTQTCNGGGPHHEWRGAAWTAGVQQAHDPDPGAPGRIVAVDIGKFAFWLVNLGFHGLVPFLGLGLVPGPASRVRDWRGRFMFAWLRYLSLAEVGNVGKVCNINVHVRGCFDDPVDWADRSDRINFRTPRLLWLQVANDLRALIGSGELRPGDKLPGEAELAEVYGVSRDTIRRATSQLAEESLLVILHGRGTFVSEQA